MFSTGPNLILHVTRSSALAVDLFLNLIVNLIIVSVSLDSSESLT